MAQSDGPPIQVLALQLLTRRTSARRFVHGKEPVDVVCAHLDCRNGRQRCARQAQCRKPNDKKPSLSLHLRPPAYRH